MDTITRATLEPGPAGGLRPSTPGWYVAHVDELEHLGTGGHSFTALEGEHRWTQFGMSIDQLQPGAGASYHREFHEDESFLVLDGACDLVIEGELHRIHAGTLVHCPAGTAHVLVGAGERPCRIWMFGARGKTPDGGTWGEYLPDPHAARLGKAVEDVTSDPAIAYAGSEPVAPTGCPGSFALDRTWEGETVLRGDGSNGSAMLEPGPYGGHVPTSGGWFILHLDDAFWVDSGRVSSAWIEGRSDELFQQYGLNVRAVRPGQPACAYHRESHFDEAMVVLAGEGLLLVEGEEVPVRAGHVFWCPRGTGHVFVGAGTEPLVLLLVGARDFELEERDPTCLEYPVDELAARHGASVAAATNSPEEAYADWPDSEPTATRIWTWRST